MRSSRRSQPPRGPSPGGPSGKRLSPKASRSGDDGAAARAIAALRPRARRILRALRKLYPEATSELSHRSAYELLVATILSAQSTDANVNRVMPQLLARYPDVRALAAASLADVEELIHSTGFFRQKARNILATSQKIVADHGGEVPDTLEGLLSLPGVARKTANVVLGTWFGKSEGIVVDTHGGRVSHRLRVTWRSRGEKDAGAIEEDLTRIVPRADWTFFGHAITLLGRYICQARRPRCGECPLSRGCPSALAPAPRSRGSGTGRAAAGTGRPGLAGGPAGELTRPPRFPPGGDCRFGGLRPGWQSGPRRRAGQDERRPRLA